MKTKEENKNITSPKKITDKQLEANLIEFNKSFDNYLELFRVKKTEPRINENKRRT